MKVGFKNLKRANVLCPVCGMMMFCTQEKVVVCIECGKQVKPSFVSGKGWIKKKGGE